MAVPLQEAFEVDLLLLEDKIAVGGGDADPTEGAGVPYPMGSLYSRTNGELWQKTGNASTDWTKYEYSVLAPLGVRHRVPTGVTVTVEDSFQYVVHSASFAIQGEVVLQGDGELVVYG